MTKKIFHSNKSEDDNHTYHSPLEKKVNELLSPFQEYIRKQATASIALLVCTFIALAWASIPSLAQHYEKLIHTSIGFHLSHHFITEPLLFWVNDVLLTLFFFLVGLEIKREFLVGELSNHKQSFLVIFAAIGGMLLPASIYTLINIGTHHMKGYGIPMATDTAFALGILTCFKSKLPKSIFTFTAALAIIDDIGVILVVAIFYTSGLNLNMLYLAAGFTSILILFNYAGVRKPIPYIVIGLLLWAAIETSGIHGTIAGIIVAFIIPARPQKGPFQFLQKIRKLLERFEKNKKETSMVLKNQQQHRVLEEMQVIAQQATTPLQRWESKLELPITLLILPLFCLVNAGIPIRPNLLSDVLTNKVSLGILIGLVIGKPLGVLLFTRISLWLKIGKLPTETSMRQLAQAAALTGIGFTMSLFITNLSFDDPHIILLAKAAILIASFCSALLGTFLILKADTQ